MNKIAIVGSGFDDSITYLVNDNFYYDERAGGIWNIATFPYPAANFDFSYYETNLGYTKFVINDKGTTSKVEWDESNAYKYEDILARYLKEKYFDWVHFVYINTIPNFEFNVDAFPAKFKSCDLSNINHPKCDAAKVVENAAKCDFIFSNGQISHALAKAIESKHYIQHNKCGGYVMKDNKILHKHFHLDEEFAYTVGAGDKLAQFFIEETLLGVELKEAHDSAHYRTIKWLKYVNEKIQSDSPSRW